MKKKSLWKKYFTLYATCLLGITTLIMTVFLIKSYTENRDMTEKNAQNSVYFADLNLSGKMKLIEERFGGMDLAEKFRDAEEIEGYSNEKVNLVAGLCAEYNDVLSVFYVDTNGRNYSAGEPMGSLNQRIEYIEDAQSSREFKTKGMKWFFAKTQNGYNACVLYRKIVYMENCDRKILGDLLIYIDTERINDNYFRSMEDNTGMLFLDSDNTVAVASQSEFLGKRFDECFIEEGGKISAPDGTTYYFCKKESGISGWHNVCYYKTGASVRDFFGITWIVFSVILIFLGIIIFISYQFSRKLGRPLEELIEHISISEKGDVTLSRADSEETDEILMLKRLFDDMSNKIKIRAELNFQQEINVKNALIKVYESQMNPHFLFNTLQIIQMLSVMQMHDEVSEITTCLGKLLRFNLSEGSETTLGAEIENIQNYFKILKYRYGDGFTYRLMVPDSLLECKVVKFMIQPFVENSVNHGFSEKVGPYEVAIVVTKINKELAIVVRDNGSGISGCRLAEIKDALAGCSETGIGIGISNVNKRIKLIYGESYGVDLFSSEKDTHAVIHIPYNE